MSKPRGEGRSGASGENACTSRGELARLERLGPKLEPQHCLAPLGPAHALHGPPGWPCL